MKSLRIITCIFVFACFDMLIARAQHEWSTWVFGQNAAITFMNQRGRTGNPRVIPSPPVRQDEGTAVYCNPRTGALELYTDDFNIRNADGTIVQPGGRRGFGPSSAQAALMLPVPGDPNQVYCFEAPDLTAPPYPHRDYHYSRLVRESAADPWRVADSSVFLIGGGTERIAATIDATRGRVIVATFAEAGGVDLWHIEKTGLVGRRYHHRLERPITVFAQTKWSRDGKYLVVADTITRIIETNHDVPSMRTLCAINVNTIPSLRGEDTRRVVYGAAISPNNSFLYLTIRVGTSRGYLLQFDLRGGFDNVERTGIPLRTFDVSRRGWPPALQNGPDGRIYWPNDRFLGCIQFPDRWGLDCGIEMQFLHLGAGRALDGLPTVVERFYSSVEDPKADMMHTFSCEQHKLVLNATISGEVIDTVWYIPGLTPDSVRGTSTLEIRNVPGGTFTAFLVMTGTRQRVVDSLELFLRPGAGYSIPRDTTVCRSSDVTIATTGIRNIRWSPANVVDNPTASTVTLRNLQSDVTLVVQATDERECAVSDTLRIRVHRANIAMLWPQPACAGVPVEVRPERGTVVEWLHNVPAADRHSASLRLVPFEPTEVVAVLSDGYCTDTIRGTITIQPPPVVSADPVEAVCPGTPTRVRVQGGDAWQWDPHPDIDRLDVQDPMISPSATTTYGFTVLFADGCVSRGSVTVPTLNEYRIPVRASNAVLNVGGSGTIRVDATNWKNEHRYGLTWPHAHLAVTGAQGADGFSFAAGTVSDTVWLDVAGDAVQRTVHLDVLSMLAPNLEFNVVPVLRRADSCAILVAEPGTIDARSCTGALRLVRFTNSLQVAIVTADGREYVQGAMDAQVPVTLRVYSTSGVLLDQHAWHGVTSFSVPLDRSQGTVVFAVVETPTERRVLPVVLR